MTVKEIYENALALNISRMEDDEEMEFFAIKLTNVMLYEAKPYNDSIRVKKGKLKLENVPKMSSLTDEIPYEEELYAALSYGLAAKLLSAQEEMTLAGLYNNQYFTMLELATPYVTMEVI